jgi:GTP-binding protein Era
MEKTHQSGYIHLFGNPNVGKSSLVKALCGQKLAIISDRPQTTRHRIFIIYNDETHQAIFSDAPGLIKNPQYKLQERMNMQAQVGTRDADLLLFCTTPADPVDQDIIFSLRKCNMPVWLIVNKIDLFGVSRVRDVVEQWNKQFEFGKSFTVSALTLENISPLFSEILDALPEGPAYYPKEDMSDRHERFFVAEIIREHIFSLFHDEIPYSCEVQVNDYKETVSKEGKPFARIFVYIIVERESQKGILLGQKGETIKELGTQARRQIEEFLGHQVYLDLQIKVEKNWRNNPEVLKKYGY